jgi:hypothetical protein
MVVIVNSAPSTLQADARSSGGGGAPIITIVTTHRWHSSHSPPHEQLLEELGAGGLLSAMHTRNPPYEQWLVGVERVRKCRHVVVSSYRLF